MVVGKDIKLKCSLVMPWWARAYLVWKSFQMVMTRKHPDTSKIESFLLSHVKLKIVEE